MAAANVYTDRYTTIGYPDPATMCTGMCEGLGVYPAYDPHYDQRHGHEVLMLASVDVDVAAIRASGKTPDTDGWVFLTCPDCGGTGKRKRVRA